MVNQSKKKYWLMKSEPNVFGIDDLAKSPHQRDCWDGVRNYQARNFMRDEMKKGDLALFYHSNATPPGIAGVIKVVKEAYPDHTAFDQESAYYDPKSSLENPRWFMVDIELVKIFKRLISLEELKKESSLKEMRVLQKGNRLSITPVTPLEFDCILGML